MMARSAGRYGLRRSDPSVRTERVRNLLWLVLLTLILLLFVQSTTVQTQLLSWIFPGESQFVHARRSLSDMALEHMLITVVATVLATVVGILAGIAVTRRGGQDFKELVLRLNSFVQTFPPSAVIILAFPVLGFGWKPALLAMFLYSLFPVLGNTIVGFESVSPALVDAARGMGMTWFQQLWIAEFPLALPMILTGVRHSYILNLGTAAIAALIGGGGLGTIIMSGLTLRNSALVLSGTLVISLLAFIGEQAFRLLSPDSRRT